MLTIDEIKERLKDANLRKVSRGAGVQYSRIFRLLKTDHKPLHETVKALSDYLEGKGDVQG
jgi:hypothetical protein